MIPLDAVRLALGRGLFAELRARSVATGRADDWIALAPELDARVSDDWAHGPMAWESRARDEGLEPLSLYEQTEHFVRLPPGWSPDPSLATVSALIADDPRGGSLWRLDFGARAGAAELAFVSGSGGRARVAVEVRTRKIDPIEGWQTMLDDLARAELSVVLDAPEAPTAVSVANAETPWIPVRTAWREFLLLRHLARTRRLHDALAAVAARSVAHLTLERRVVPLSRATRLRPEDLVTRSDASAHGLVTEDAAVVTNDTPENRFVLYVLTVVESLARGLVTRCRDDVRDRSLATAAAGLAGEFASLHNEAAGVTLRGVRAQAAMAPFGSAALQRRPGYRDFLAVWLWLESSSPRLDHAREVPGFTGVRDAAALYERWCALTVAATLGLDARSTLDLLYGRARVEGQFEGERIAVESQRAFSMGESYTLAFRPDLTITARARRLHLDAKYRLETARESQGVPRDEIVKMHAYRDAIRGTWGSYAFYPGEGPREERYVAPGGGEVGALALRPGEDAIGAQRVQVTALVRRFLRG